MHDDAEHVRYDGVSPGTHDAPRHDDGRWKEEEDEGLNCADTLGKSKVTTDMSFLLSTPYPSPLPLTPFLPKSTKAHGIFMIVC